MSAIIVQIEQCVLVYYLVGILHLLLHRSWYRRRWRELQMAIGPTPRYLARVPLPMLVGVDERVWGRVLETRLRAIRPWWWLVAWTCVDVALIGDWIRCAARSWRDFPRAKVGRPDPRSGARAFEATSGPQTRSSSASSSS